MTSTSKVTLSEKSIRSQKSSISLGSLELIGNLKLKSYIEDENKHQIIVSIREEIIENALNEIYSKYIDKQSVKFVVHCACNALEKIVDLYFYHHDHGQPYYDNHPAWTPGIPPKPSTPDSWAPQYTPMGTKQDIPEIDLPEFAPFAAQASFHSKSKSELGDADGISEIVDEMISESTVDSAEGQVTPLDIVSTVESKKHPSLASLFATIKTGPKSFLPISYDKVKKKAAKESDPNVEKVCPPYKSGLPPIRVEPIFREKEDEDEVAIKKGKSDTKKLRK